MIDNKKNCIVLLKSILDDYPETKRMYECLLFMCTEELERNLSGTEIVMITRTNMQVALDKVTTAKNKWLNEDDFKNYADQIIEENLAQFEQIGYKPILKVSASKGGAGNEKKFWFEIESLDVVEDEIMDEQIDVERIQYRRIPSKDVKISFFMKFLFKNGELKNRSIRGLVFFLILLISFFIVAGFFTLTIFVVALTTMPILLQLLFIGLFVSFFYVMTKFGIMPFWSLVESRVVKAPLYTLSIKEYDADIEMHRDGKIQRTRFTRFIAHCPICTGEISLRNGKEYNQPLVGRCIESPFMHVYSFDRATLKGYLLVKP